MKKLVFVLAGAFLLTSMLSSCKKDYDCVCTAAGVSATTVIPNAKKKDAQDACDIFNTAYLLQGGSCTLND